MPPLRADEIPQGCRLALVSPYDVRFSQFRIRAEFQDGRSIEEAQTQIEAVSYNEDEEVDLLEMEDFSAERGKEFEVLQAPFPQIEVTRWRCKLREADGSPKTDPDTGLELYSSEERWFTFDNRRLCCLQRAAVELWPREVRICVIVIPPALARSRELRKFDTKTSGCSVLIGRRDDPNPDTWCWRTKVGVPLEDHVEEGVARQRSSRFRRSGSGRFGAAGEREGPPSGAYGRGRRTLPVHCEDEDKQGLDIFRSATLFLIVYLALRLILSIFKKTRLAFPSVATSWSLDGGVGHLVGGLLSGQNGGGLFETLGLAESGAPG